MLADTVRARRSCLSVPASSEKMLAKARGLPADEIVIDLEDAVAADLKDDARGSAVAALGEDWGGRAVAVRINGIGTEWWERDAAKLAAAAAPPSSLVVPKCERAAEIEAVAGAAPELGLQALIETAAGLVNVVEIAAASPQLEALIIGYADLTASLGLPASANYEADRWHWAREQVLVHARAAGLAAIDGPWLEIADEDGLRSSAAEARALGYDGKWAIHPSQIEALNEAFSPSREEFERATAILDALERAAADEGRGAVRLDGAMIDEASRKQATVVVARGEAAGLRRG
ncbi:MAG: CoA ester lyase [Actinomycetota bacterium]|nr:CoA ester lyase [Actinomycetota bacterium]